MTTITFQHPPALDKSGYPSTDPFNDFDPSCADHYPTGHGIYIYGIRKNTQINNVNKKIFIPQYVGQGNLQNRLFTSHYMGIKMNGNHLSELWDWESKHSDIDVNKVYTQMNSFDGLGVSKVKNLLSILGSIPDLIWFNDKSFFDAKIPKFKSKYIGSSGQMHSIGKTGDLDVTGNPHAVALKQKIELNKISFNKDFYFIYISQKHVDDNSILLNSPILHDLEAIVKERLKSILIHTTAKANPSKVITKPVQVDLSQIQDRLICLPGNSYGYPNYTKPLILK
ncbi:MAG: hypothetical protein JNL57_10745 [Bacteroidetes bacterium]|nr:hypothetical protein [Bacteroidota bacterium]